MGDFYIVMIDDKASVRLLTASKVIAMEFTRIPIVALNATSIKFTTMPMMLVLTILSCLDIKLIMSYSINKIFILTIYLNIKNQSYN